MNVDVYMLYKVTVAASLLIRDAAGVTAKLFTQAPQLLSCVHVVLIVCD